MKPDPGAAPPLPKTWRRSLESVVLPLEVGPAMAMTRRLGGLEGSGSLGAGFLGAGLGAGALGAGGLVGDTGGDGPDDIDIVSDPDD